MSCGFASAAAAARADSTFNRSETRVELLFDLAGSPSLTEAQRMTLQRRLGRHIDAEGTLRVVSSSTRSQLENRADAVTRFQALLAGALIQRKRRVATRPSAAAHARRLDQKRARGSTKAGRAHVRDDRGLIAGNQKPGRIDTARLQFIPARLDY